SGHRRPGAEEPARAAGIGTAREREAAPVVRLDGAAEDLAVLVDELRLIGGDFVVEREIQHRARGASSAQRAREPNLPTRFATVQTVFACNEFPCLLRRGAVDVVMVRRPRSSC